MEGKKKKERRGERIKGKRGMVVGESEGGREREE